MKLKHIVANEKNIVFDILTDDEKRKLMFGDIQETDSVDLNQAHNALSLLQCNSNKSILIHNLYNSTLPFYKTAIYSKSKTNRHNNTYDFQNITLCKQDSKLVNVINVENTMYAIAPLTEKGHYDIEEDIYDWIANPSNDALPIPNQIQTDIYNTEYILSCYGTEDFEPKDAILSSFENIKYNMIFEMPGNINNDFYSGNVIASTFKGKNLYNSLYNMQHDDDFILKNARQYYRVGACNNQLYLIYNDNLNYSANNRESLQNDFLNMSFQKVELLTTLNRYADLNGHKTGLYTIVIHNNILNLLTSDVQMQNVKMEILNNVEKIAKKLQPAQTQLFNVEVIND